MSLTPSFLFWKNSFKDNILVFRSDGFPITFEKGGSTIHAKDIKHALTFLCVYIPRTYVRGRTWFLTLCLRWIFFILGGKDGDLLREEGGLRIKRIQRGVYTFDLEFGGLGRVVAAANNSLTRMLQKVD